MDRARLTTLSIAIAGDEPPSEFRIFAAGANETVKGTFVFDDVAAASVMREYRAHGIDLPLDYDHAMLGTDRAPDPAQAGKAAGWFELEVRNGELWAVNVRWTPPAADALQRKEWRFMSPAFQADESGRVLSLLNVAITNLPATRRLEPLMAASLTALGANGMTLEEFLKVVKALGIDMTTPLDEAMAKIKGESPADPDAKTEDAPPPVGDGGADEGQEMAQDPNAPPAKEDKAAVAASITRLTSLTSKTTLTAAVAEIEIWRASHLKLESETQKLAAERAAIELGQRKENVKKLIALGAETPATAWASEGKLTKRLADEPLDEQNKRVATLLSARGGKLPSAPVPPPNGGGDGSQTFETKHGVVTLSASELETCKSVGAKPEDYATNKALHLKARGSKE